MNISKNYYNNSVRKIDSLIFHMNLELSELFDSIVENAPIDEDNIIEFKVFMLSKKGEYNYKSNIIITKYEKQIIKEQNKQIERAGKNFGYGYDNYFKRSN